MRTGQQIQKPKKKKKNTKKKVWHRGKHTNAGMQTPSSDTGPGAPEHALRQRLKYFLINFLPRFDRSHSHPASGIRSGWEIVKSRVVTADRGFHVYPRVLNGVQIRTVGRPIHQNQNFVEHLCAHMKRVIADRFPDTHTRASMKEVFHEVWGEVDEKMLAPCFGGIPARIAPMIVN